MQPGESTLSILSLAKYGVRFGDRVILASVDLEVPPTGPFVLLGPGGTGKSTLLRSLAGFNDRNPAFVSWGEAIYAGAPVEDENRPALVAQSARLVVSTVGENLVHNHPERRRLSPLQQRELAAQLCMDYEIPHFRDRLDQTMVDLTIAEQRAVAIVRLAAGDPSLLCLDEPTSDIEESDAQVLLEHIARVSESRAVLVVLHHQGHAQCLGGQCALLAGGYVIESRATSAFLEAPQTEQGGRFVRTGSCNAPAPDAVPEELSPEAPAPHPLPEEAAPPVPPESRGPTGFLWIRPGRLAGTPLPGVFHPLDYDLDAVQRMGVTVLISLTREALEEEDLRVRGIRGISSPIPDMCAPGLTQAWGLCARIEQELDAGEVVAVHCRAGHGRTGTILACFCVWEGADPLDALEEVRAVDDRWVQSGEQEAFIERFGQFIARRGGGVTRVRDVQEQPSL